MQNDQLLKRLQELEREVTKIRSELVPKQGLRHVFAKTGMFFISYWALMSFFAAVATATYVKYAFNIDYFETYRNASAVKRLSEFHREMGDELFVRNDWKQALASYQAAKEANPANVNAALGIVKSSVFLPEEGKKYTDPVTVAAKIAKLRALYPRDPQVAFLDAIQAFNSGDDSVVTKCDEVLREHKKYPGGYLLKSYILQSKGDFKGAAEALEKLLVFDHEDGLAQSNLGYCYLFTGEREKALEMLEKGARNYPSMVNSISLAEVYRSLGRLDETRQMLDFVDHILADKDVQNEYYVGGTWLWNHLPERDGDVESQLSTIQCATMDQKTAVLRISQGLLALESGDDTGTAAKLGEAMKLAPEYKPFLLNKLRAAGAFDNVSAEVRAKCTFLADELAK